MKWEVRDSGRTVVQPTDTGYYLIAQYLHPEHAKIIAVAPEMLKAFSDIHKWLVDEGLDADMPAEYQDAALAVFDKVNS